jgi:SAM-dependent methyltransferase
VHAVDYDQAMIDLLWRPGDGRHCHRARWQEMPFPDGFFDLVVGDCSFNALPRPDDYADVLREIGRVRSPAAALIVRAFVQSEPRLTLAGLARDGGVAVVGFRTAEVRLLVAIAAAKADGTLHFTDIPGRIREEWGNVEDYLAALSHSPADIERTRSVLALDQRLNYPTEREVAERFAPWFARIEFAYPDYAVGRNCPNIRCYPE